MTGGPEPLPAKAVGLRPAGVWLAVLGKQRRKRHFAANPELPVNGRQMGSNGGGRYEKCLANFAIGHPLGEFCRDHPFPIRQAGEGIGRNAKHRFKTSDPPRAAARRPTDLAARRKYYRCDLENTAFARCPRAAGDPSLSVGRVSSTDLVKADREASMTKSSILAAMLVLLLSTGPCLTQGTQRDAKPMSENAVRAASAQLYSDILARACRNGWRYPRSQIENGFKRHLEELEIAAGRSGLHDRA